MPEPAGGYPILLHLQDRQVAVIGGGRVGTRKTKHLLRSGARVLLVAPKASPDLKALAADGAIKWMNETYRRDMLNDYMPVLVIATTPDPRVNQTVAQDAHRIRALCNVANGSSDDSDFSNMALIEKPPLTIALSSNGQSPALVRQLKRQLTQDLGDEYAVLADWLGALRASLPGDSRSQADRQRLYEDIVTSEVLALLRAGDRNKAQRVFQQILLEGATE